MSQQKTWFTGIWQINGPQLNKLACANIWADELDGDLNCRDHIKNWHPKLELHKKEPFPTQELFFLPVFFHLVENIFPSCCEKQPFFFFFIPVLAFTFLMTALSLIRCCQTCAVKAWGCVSVFSCSWTTQFQQCHFYKAGCDSSQEQCKTKTKVLMEHWSIPPLLWDICARRISPVVPLHLQPIWVFPKCSLNKKGRKNSVWYVWKLHKLPFFFSPIES